MMLGMSVAYVKLKETLDKTKGEKLKQHCVNFEKLTFSKQWQVRFFEVCFAFGVFINRYLRRCQHVEGKQVPRHNCVTVT